MGDWSDRGFVGRDADRELLQGFLTDAAEGRGRLVLFAGEPGVGKTRLVAVVGGDAVALGMAPLWGTCWPGDGAPPLWPWTQVLREAAALGRGLRPDLVEQVTSGESPSGLLGDPDPTDARFRLFDRVATGLREAAIPGPLLIVLDDLQWADRVSLQLLLFVTRALRSAPVAVIGTYRDTELAESGPLTEFLNDVSGGAE